MLSLIEIDSTLQKLGARLRGARIASNQSMAVFAQRVGVSVPTLRAMESGQPTTKIGHWLTALWALDRLPEADEWLAERASLIDQALARRQPVRRRARRRPQSIS